MTPSTVGVLALQGAFAAHRAAFHDVGVSVREVRRVSDLDGLRALMIPGGESTTIAKGLDRLQLYGPIQAFAEAGHPVLGTCAGAILLARRVTGPEQESLGVLDIDVERNAYGRQVDSFKKRIRLDAFARELECVFIRAPKFRQIGPRVRVLARDGREPILLTAPGLLASTFHPELSGDPLIHRHFLSQALWSANREEVAAS